MQVQNLPRGEKAVKKRLELALDLLNREDYDGIVREFTDTKDPKDSITVVDFVITLMRSLFQATPGKKIIVADLNAIENRVLGYLARCPAINKVFQEGLDPYLAFAVSMFNQPYEVLLAEFEAGNKEKRTWCKAPVLGGGTCRPRPPAVPLPHGLTLLLPLPLPLPSGHTPASLTQSLYLCPKPLHR